MKTACPRCKGRLIAKTISYTQPYEGRLYLVDNVPALVCEQCGETLLRPRVAQRIQRLVRAGRPHGKRTLPVYDLQAVGSPDVQ